MNINAHIFITEVFHIESFVFYLLISFINLFTSLTSLDIFDTLLTLDYLCFINTDVRSHTVC